MNLPFFLSLNLIDNDDLASELPETVTQPEYWPYIHIQNY